MKRWRFTLLADGPSDASLMPVLNWLWAQHYPHDIATGRFAELDFDTLPSRKLADRLGPAVDLFPCDVLFVHRDAEKEPLSARVKEIEVAIASRNGIPPAVRVVPVRMTEAWMLFDAKAIRKAAGNPNGTTGLKLPKFADMEKLPDPKLVLYEALRTASELPSNRLSRFNAPGAARLVTEYITDFSLLRRLKSFTQMEEEFKRLKLTNSYRH